jgi:uncharacterized membrane protein (DUF2068 family)
VTEKIIDSATKISIRKPRHNRWLMLIAAFKLGQALLFIAVGFSVLRLIHHDLPDLVLRWARHMHFSPESHFVDFILDRVSIVDDSLLRRFGVGLFAYAAVGTVEGIGLYLEKTWAEYMTFLITASFLPWEVFEIFKRVTLIHSSLLVVNFLVFLYLLKVVVERGKHQGGDATSVEQAQ